MGESVLLRAMDLAAASSSEDPRARLESLSRVRTESVESTLGLLAATLESVAFASAPLQRFTPNRIEVFFQLLCTRNEPEFIGAPVGCDLCSTLGLDVALELHDRGRTSI